MQSSLPEKPQEATVPPVPLKTYQWEDVKRARQQGGYPWTYLDKEPLQEEDITAETVLRDSTPCRSVRSMSREQSRERSGGRSPGSTAEDGSIRILMLDASPGSSRKLGEGEEDVAHVPNFSKEISLDSEEDLLEKPAPAGTPRSATPDLPPKEPKITLSPKGILKRKHSPKPKVLAEDSPRNSKCCHPFVEKIKNIADKTLHKTEKILPKKDASHMKKIFPSSDEQEIIPLECSPGTERRERQKLAEHGNIESPSPTEVKISLVMQPSDVTENSPEIYDLDSSPSSRRRKEHIYEDIDKNEPINDNFCEKEIGESNDIVNQDTVKPAIINNVVVTEPPPAFMDAKPQSCVPMDTATPSNGALDSGPSLTTDVNMDIKPKSNLNVETKSGDSNDPSLLIDDPMDDEESTSESITKIKAMYDISMTPDKLVRDISNEAIVLEAEEVSDIEKASDEEKPRGSPNVTITEVTDDILDDQHLKLDENMPENVSALDRRVHFEMSESISDPKPSEEYPPDDGKENVWSKMSDHEYEPIGKPTESDVGAARGEGAGEAAGGSVGDRGWAGEADDASSTTSQERQFLRAEEDNEAFSASATDGEPDTEHDAMLLQKEIEDRFFVNTPTTTESRTDCEISTSQVDSSALEDLPLKRENRKKSAVAVETSKLKQKIKNQTGKISTQAGKLKTKLKTIKKPQFHMPERPKFNMPERPKFNMPERPKFNLPERPKFNFPDRPKINLPEKSKFRLPDRPKINLPDRPKFNFPDRPKFSMPDRSKFKLPDRPKLNFSTFSRNKESNRKTKTNDDIEISTESTSGSNKKPMINFDFRTYPRLFGKNKKEKRDGKERPGTPPPGFATVPRMTRDRQQVVASQWDHASSKTDDEPRQYGVPLDYSYEPDFETKLAQVDKDYRQMQEENKEDGDTTHQTKVSHKTARAVIDNQELWNKLERTTVQKMEHGSSLPHILPGNEENGAYDESRVTEDDESSAASTGQHRRGVLEEIDNDEFFLRQKGISQDNIEVGKYLSDEIRDAFRSPVNALSQMDSGNRYNRDEYIDDHNLDSSENIGFYKYKDDDDNDEHLGYDADLNTNETMAENDDGYYTFPPVRPSRAKKLKALAKESEKTSYDATHVENIVQLQNVNLEEIPTPEIFTDPIAKSFEAENIRKHVFTSSFKEPEMLENLNEYENEMEQTRDVPMIPKRRKRSTKDFNYSENGSMDAEMFDRDDWNEPISTEDKDNSKEIIVHRTEHIIPYSTDNEDPPALPRRNRSRGGSRGGSRGTSICDDDRTSRGAESIILDSHTQLAPVDLDFMDDIDDGPGYAVVDKNSQNKKIDAPPRPPAPMRRQRSAKSLSGERQYFTVPRALKESPPPRRPSRNYSTLGPSRPPRKKSTSSLTTSEVDFRHHDSSTDVTQYVEIEDEDQETQKDLKSGDVISKMKDRPLPPPPRPPRGPKKKRDKEDSLDKKDDDQDMIQSQDANQPQEFFHSQDMINSPAIDQILQSIHSQDMVDSQNLIISERFDEMVPHEEKRETDFLKDSDKVTKKKIESDTAILSDEKENLGSYDQEEVIEIEVSTQTDPLPDDFDYDLGMDEPLVDHFDYIPDTVADFLKEEREEPEENSIDVEIFSRGIQKFRESSRPSSRASKTRTPIDRPRTPLGRMSPTAILIERRVSSPTRINERDVIVTEASLTVQPVDEPPAEPEPTTFVPVNRMYPSVDSPPYTRNWTTHLSQTAPTTVQTIPSREEHMSIRQPLCLSDDNMQIETESRTLLPNDNAEIDVLRTRRLQVSDLDVERLNVAELQAGKILVSEIEGLSLQVADLNSKSGHIVVRGLELAPGVIEEILQRFSQMVPPATPTAPAAPEASTSTSATSATVEAHQQQVIEHPRPDTNQETQTEVDQKFSDQPSNKEDVSQMDVQERIAAAAASDPVLAEPPPERPPLPHIHPLASSIYPLAYYPEYSIPPGSFYRLRNPSERHPEEVSEPDLPSAPNRRRKHKREPAISSSDEEYRPINRRAPPTRSTGEPSVSELSIQLFRACQNSVSRSVRHILSYISSHFGGGEDKKDVQMALVIFLVMIAGLIMLGVGDGRTVHHHHWDFFNPPNNEK